MPPDDECREQVGGPLPTISKKEQAERTARYQEAKKGLKIIKVYTKAEMDEIAHRRGLAIEALRRQQGDHGRPQLHE